jgi:hypothetical protein
MAIEWDTVGKDAIAAMLRTIGADMRLVDTRIAAQINGLVRTAQSIERNRNSLTTLEYQSLALSQRRALHGLLATYAGISIVVAEQAAEAAWNVVAQALKAASVAFV